MKMCQSKPLPPTLLVAEVDKRPVIDAFVKKIDRVPLLNIAGGIIQDYQYLWENYYFPSMYQE